MDPDPGPVEADVRGDEEAGAGAGAVVTVLRRPGRGVTVTRHGAVPRCPQLPPALSTIPAPPALTCVWSQVCGGAWGSGECSTQDGLGGGIQRSPFGATEQARENNLRLCGSMRRGTLYPRSYLPNVLLPDTSAPWSASRGHIHTDGRHPGPRMKPPPTATEFFMSATAEVNSLKCSSGQ